MFCPMSNGSSGCDSVWYRYDLTKEATDAIAELIPEKVFPLGAANDSAA